MSSQKVLIIESDRGFAKKLAKALEPYQFETDIVGDGAKGLSKAKSDPPDLIVLCVELPKMSGYAVCNKLKKSSALKSIPLIIMSAEATPETFEQHKKLKARADDYILKDDSFSTELFLEKVDGLVTLQEAAVELPEEGEVQDVEFEDDEATQVVDTELAAETDAAFAALEVEQAEGEGAAAEEEVIEEVAVEDIEEAVGTVTTCHTIMTHLFQK